MANKTGLVNGEAVIGDLVTYEDRANAPRTYEITSYSTSGPLEYCLHEVGGGDEAIWSDLRQVGWTFAVDGPRCESGWTGDRCVFALDHDGPHSNESAPTVGTGDGTEIPEPDARDAARMIVDGWYDNGGDVEPYNAATEAIERAFRAQDRERVIVEAIRGRGWTTLRQLQLAMGETIGSALFEALGADEPRS